MKSIYVTLLFFLLVNTLAFAQDFKEGKITKEELSQTVHPKDSSAVAAVLHEEAYLTMRYDEQWIYEMEVVKRIKIYSQEGYDYATITIPYYYGDTNNSREDIKNIKAYTYNLEGNKVKDEKVKRSDIVDEQVSEYWKQMKFTFPNLKPGSVIEYSYTYESPNINELPEWTFQEDIPVDYSKYIHVIPYYFGYSAYSRGYHYIAQEKEVIKTFVSFSQSATDFNYGGVMKQSTDTGNLELEANKTTYIATNVPKLKDEPFVNNYNNFMTSVRHEIAFTKNPDGQVKEYSTNWRKVSESLQKSEGFGVELDKTNYYEEDLEAILTPGLSAEEKINVILNFVKERMRWNDYVGIYTSDKLKNAYKDRTGSAAQINLMLTSMLRYAGLNANPVILSTISNGIPLNIASTQMYNYVISAVELTNGGLVLLDATEKYSAPNLLPTRCLNWRGQLIRPDGNTKEIQLNPTTSSKDNFIMNLDVDATGKVTGKMRRHLTNQYAYQYRVNYSTVDKDSYIENLENSFNVSISEYSNKNIDQLSKPVTQTIAFEKESAADVINGDIYISPLLFLAQKENPFKQNMDDRKLPLDFTFPKSQKFMVYLKIPDGYTVDYYPEPVAIGLPNNAGLYRFNISEAASGNLQIVVTKDINQFMLSPDYYLPMKDFYKEIVQKETDKIVLKKI
jgi:hypothetical protein